MSRIPLVERHAAAPDRQATLDAVQGALGGVPNMFRAVANSRAALRSMWGSFAALGQGVLGAALGEQIAVAVAQRNHCEYCLAAHTALGQKAGLSADTLRAAQAGESADPRTAAALRFALALVEQRGQVSAAQVQAVRDAGFDDEALMEIVAHVALNLFTNYVNVAFEVPVDFPRIGLHRAG
jgi:uncharacterized peroxidase-related enzyme